MATSLGDIVNHGTDTGLYQRALDIAENQRNFQGNYTQFGAGQSALTAGQQYGNTGGEGGSGNAQVDWSAMQTPGWSGPDAYGLQNFDPNNRFGAGSEDEVQATLARIRKFDPNAHVETITADNGESGTSQQYHIAYDESKLPKMEHPGNDIVTAGQYGTNRLFREDDKAFAVDPHYGVLTSRRNLKPEETGWLDVAGPAAVMLFGILAGGGFPMLSSVLNAPRVLSSLGNGGSPIDFIPGGSTARRLFNPPGG